MQNNTYDQKSSLVTLWKIKQNYPKTLLDGSFQRWGGIFNGSGWGNTTGRSYLDSLVNSDVFNYIMVANIDESLKFAKEQQDEQSIEYFTNLQSLVDEEGERKYEYVSIDGNNTSSVVYGFLTGHEEMYVEEALQSGKKKKKFFKDFTEDEQNEIQYNEKLTFIELRRISVFEMCNLFRKLNQQTKLNDQEYRQATLSQLASSIRDHGSTYRDLFLNFVYNNEDNLDKRHHEELIAQLALKVENNYSQSLKKKSLDIFYEENLHLSENAEKTLETLLEIASKISTSVGKLNTKITKGTLHNLFDAISITLGADYEIIDHAKYYSWFLGMDAELRAVSKRVTEEELEEKSYAHWTRFFNRPLCQDKIRRIIRLRWLESKQELLSNEVLKKKNTRDHKDRFSAESRLILWYLQNGKTRDGEKIDIIDLYRTGKYEVDHMVSVKDGGPTSIANAELMRREENRAKGPNSAEPHFEHQEKEENNLDISVAI